MYIKQKESAGGCLFLGLSMYSMISDKTKNPIRENRGLLAVVLDGVAHALCTCAMVYALSFWMLIIVYIFEMVYVIKVIINYFRSQK